MPEETTPNDQVYDQDSPDPEAERAPVPEGPDETTPVVDTTADYVEADHVVDEATNPIEAETTTPIADVTEGIATAEPAPAKPAKAKRTPRATKKKAEPPVAPPAAESTGPAAEPGVDDSKKWYVVKVQSGREESIKEAIERRVKIEGLEEFFGEILIPVEKEKVLHKGKRVERERKLFPGYIMAKVDFNDQILYLFRETSGVGDFVGGGPSQKPQPMTEQEVARMTGQKFIDSRPKGATTGAAPYTLGERVKVKEGVFSGMEGDIKEVLEAKEQVRVELFVLGRPVSVELDYWQVELV